MARVPATRSGFPRPGAADGVKFVLSYSVGTRGRPPPPARCPSPGPVRPRRRPAVEGLFMHARLILEAGECVPAALDLNPSHPATLGRSRENSLVVKNDLVSRLHVKIYFEDGRWVLRDFGLNGTRVNGVKVNGAVPLADGAVIQLGEAKLRFAVTAGKPPPAQTAAPVTPPPGTIPLVPEGGTNPSPALS